jgi:hypothetical protein
MQPQNTQAEVHDAGVDGKSCQIDDDEGHKGRHRASIRFEGPRFVPVKAVEDASPIGKAFGQSLERRKPLP